jgi:hypothetical protein
VFVIFLNVYIQQSLGEDEIEESNARHFIEGKVIIQGDKLPGIIQRCFNCFRSNYKNVSNSSEFPLYVRKSTVMPEY